MPDAEPLPSADSGDAADMVAYGIRLAELIEQLPVSRGSVFELVKALGITTAKGPGPGGKGRVAWLSADDAYRVSNAAQRVARGEVRIADLSGLASLRTQQTPPGGMPAPPPPEQSDPAPFLARLEAAERAMRSGLGLTTSEAAWILGVRPGSREVVRGGIRATRTGWNCWWLTSADSADAAD